MSLHDELLDTARYLLRRNQNRPTQADLRRSVSTAYYALFHMLVDDRAGRMAAGPPQDALARAFGHTEMKRTCQLVQKSSLPPAAVPLFGPTAPPEMVGAAKVFIRMQYLRHDADYNRGWQLDRSGVRIARTEVEGAFADWGRVRGTPAAHVFLMLLLGDRWSRG